MSRRPMMAANWKMNKTVREAEEYTAALLPRAADAEEDVDVAVCVPFTCLHEVGRMAEDSAIMAGAQNFYFEDSGGESVFFPYEPIWAIGTGDTATPEDAQDAIGKIRGLLGESQGDDFAGSVRILYGGSVKPENASEIMAQEDVDGALVGGASLEVESFVELIGAAQNAVAGTDE